LKILAECLKVTGSKLSMRGRFNRTENLPADLSLLLSIELEILAEEAMEDQGLLLDSDRLEITEIKLRGGLIGRVITETEDQEVHQK